MKISWPYKLALALSLLLVVVFIASPYLAMNTLTETIKSNNVTAKKWQAQVKAPYLTWYTKRVLDAMLQAEISLAMKAKEMDKENAMLYYMVTYSDLNKQANKIISAKGFSHFLCGELARFPEYPEQHDSDCWVMDGSMQWQSPTLVEIRYKNPAFGWFSSLYLQRIGLFDWQVAGAVLPIEKILVQLEQNLSNKS